jgi:dipeptidyl aminopeptidase/acylaminoacyl peptidase
MQEDRSSIKILLFISIILNIILVGAVYYFYTYNVNFLSPLSDKKEEIIKTLQKYSYKSLTETIYTPEKIIFGPVEQKATETTPYETRRFYYEIEGKKVSGLAHFPAEKRTYPVVVMIRGYVEPDQYQPGIGSSPAARYFASHGYITLAPDFLGYGESDKPPTEPFADRLMTYPTVLQLLADIDKLNTSLETSSVNQIADESKVGIWAHSNGGQIALSVLEASQKPYPTVLWAPVSKPFPYSVLYFTDEFDDHGRYLRKLISQFEDIYDIESFSLTNYLDQIKAPIQLHQGGNDDAVPIKWSNQLYSALKADDVDIEYYTYPESDHNMRPDWDTAVERSLQFYDKQLKQ